MNLTHFVNFGIENHQKAVRPVSDLGLRHIVLYFLMYNIIFRNFIQKKVNFIHKKYKKIQKKSILYKKIQKRVTSKYGIYKLLRDFPTGVVHSHNTGNPPRQVFEHQAPLTRPLEGPRAACLASRFSLVALIFIDFH